MRFRGPSTKYIDVHCLMLTVCIFHQFKVFHVFCYECLIITEYVWQYKKKEHIRLCFSDLWYAGQFVQNAQMNLTAKLPNRKWGHFFLMVGHIQTTLCIRKSTHNSELLNIESFFLMNGDDKRGGGVPLGTRADGGGPLGTRADGSSGFWASKGCAQKVLGPPNYRLQLYLFIITTAVKLCRLQFQFQQCLKSLCVCVSSSSFTLTGVSLRSKLITAFENN